MMTLNESFHDPCPTYEGLTGVLWYKSYSNVAQGGHTGKKERERRLKSRSTRTGQSYPNQRPSGLAEGHGIFIDWQITQGWVLDNIQGVNWPWNNIKIWWLACHFRKLVTCYLTTWSQTQTKHLKSSFIGGL